MIDHRLAVALVLLAVVVLPVALVMWRLAERSLRRVVQISEGRRIRIRRLVREVARLTTDNTLLRAELARLTATAALSDEPPARCRWSDQTLADIHSLPTTSPEDQR